MLGKIIKNGKAYEFCELDEPETYTTVNRLIEFNLGRFWTVLGEVKKYAFKIGLRLSDRQLVDITIAIMDKCAIRSFPVLQTALCRKVNNAKEWTRYEQETKRESAYEQQKPEPDIEDAGNGGHEF